MGSKNKRKEGRKRGKTSEKMLLLYRPSLVWEQETVLRLRGLPAFRRDEHQAGDTGVDGGSRGQTLTVVIQPSEPILTINFYLSIKRSKQSIIQSGKLISQSVIQLNNKTINQSLVAWAICLSIRLANLCIIWPLKLI